MVLKLIDIEKDTPLENSNIHPKNQAIPPTPKLSDGCSIQTIILYDELRTDIVIEINNIELGDGSMK